MSGRKDGRVRFDDYLLERMEPVDSSPESGRDGDENAGRQGPRSQRRDKHESERVTNSQGGEEPDGLSAGRRIDLRA